MGRVTKWECQYGDKNYSFSHEKLIGKHVLKIDGVPVEIKPSFINSLYFFGFDEPFNFGDKEARLVIEGKKPDIVIEGKYLSSGKQYIATPKWFMVFIILLFPLIIVGGALGGVFLAVGSLLCKKVSRLDKSNTTRIALCVTISIGSWLAWLVIGVFIRVLIGS